MLTNILYVLLALLMLGFIIIVHELGHYAVGRLCGIGVLEFNVGFGPKLFSWERKGIQYAVRAIPLGGSCMFVGEDEQNENPRAMNNQPVWKRFLTVAAGPVMNFLLAFVVCAVMLDGFMIAQHFTVIESVSEGMPAQAAGLLPGDRVIEIEGFDVTNDDAGVAKVIETIQAIEPGGTVRLAVDRDGERIDLDLQTVAVAQEGEDAPARHGMIGIQFGGRTYTFGEAIRYSGAYMVSVTRSMLDTLRGLFFHGKGLTQMTSAVGIVAVVSELARDGIGEVLWLIFIISLNLGIMNLLPLPALDGGRLVFLIVEAIRRKPIPPEKEGMVHGIGLMLLLGLISVLMVYDVYRLIIGGVGGLM